MDNRLNNYNSNGEMRWWWCRTVRQDEFMGAMRTLSTTIVVVLKLFISVLHLRKCN